MTETVKAAWLNAGSYLAREDRCVIRALRSWAGVVDTWDLYVLAMGTPDMRTQTWPGRCIIDGTESPASQGSYSFAPPDTAILTHTASTSLPRHDIVGVRVRDADFSGASYLCQREILQGTPAASPVDPTRPANWLDLARVNVRANTTSILQSDITDLRDRFDQRSFYAKIHSTTGDAGGFSVPNGSWNPVPMSASLFDPSGMKSGNTLILPVSGWWLVEHRTSLNAGGFVYTLGSSLWSGGGAFLIDQDLRKFDATWPFAGITGKTVMRWFAKGTILGLYIYQSTGSSSFIYVTDEGNWPMLAVSLIG